MISRIWTIARRELTSYFDHATAYILLVIFLAIRLVMGLRVSPEEELEGLDYGEHGMHAYDFELGGSGQLDQALGRRAALTQLAAPVVPAGESV